MRYGTLRIAWSVVWGVVAVLLITFWIRGYRNYERFVGPNQRFIVDVNKRLCIFSTYGLLAPERELKPFFVRRAQGIAVGVPISLTIVAACAVSIAPWMLYRFSLRTLLIATTLLAIVLGLIAWAAR
jgi:hypothetical protein